MDTFLGDLSLNGDLQQYIRILGEHGMHTFDDLMLDEPELEDLFEWGIEDIVGSSSLRSQPFFTRRCGEDLCHLSS